MHYRLGAALRQKGDRAGAVAAFRKALEIAPGYAEAEANLKAILAEKRPGDKPPQRAPGPNKE